MHFIDKNQNRKKMYQIETTMTHIKIKTNFTEIGPTHKNF